MVKEARVRSIDSHDVTVIVSVSQVWRFSALFLWLVFLVQSTNGLQNEEHGRTDHEHPVDNTSWHS